MYVKMANILFLRLIVSKGTSLNHSCRFKSTNIGFVGLGNMGGSMAINLAKKGHSVTLYDLNPVSIDAVKARAPELDFKSAKSVESLAEDKNIKAIVSVLPESSHVLSVFGDKNKKGLLSVQRNDLLFIDCTTGNISAAKELEERVLSSGSEFVDAPISGGVMAANEATLTFMVGANSDATFELAKPILEAMGKKIFHCGKVGTGLAAKICNNMLLAISMIGTSEAMSMGISLGLDPKTLNEIINCSSGRCWSSEVYNPVPGVLPNVPASKNYEGGFSTLLMTKDLGLAQNASTQAKVAIPLGSLAHQLYRVMSQTPHGKKDFSAIFEFLKAKNL